MPPPRALRVLPAHLSGPTSHAHIPAANVRQNLAPPLRGRKVLPVQGPALPPPPEGVREEEERPVSAPDVSDVPDSEQSYGLVGSPKFPSLGGYEVGDVKKALQGAPTWEPREPRERPVLSLGGYEVGDVKRALQGGPTWEPREPPVPSHMQTALTADPDPDLTPEELDRQFNRQFVLLQAFYPPQLRAGVTWHKRPHKTVRQLVGWEHWDWAGMREIFPPGEEGLKKLEGMLERDRKGAMVMVKVDFQLFQYKNFLPVVGWSKLPNYLWKYRRRIVGWPDGVQLPGSPVLAKARWRATKAAEFLHSLWYHKISVEAWGPSEDADEYPTLVITQKGLETDCKNLVKKMREEEEKERLREVKKLEKKERKIERSSRRAERKAERRAEKMMVGLPGMKEALLAIGQRPMNDAMQENDDDEENENEEDEDEDEQDEDEEDEDEDEEDEGDEGDEDEEKEEKR